MSDRYDRFVFPLISLNLAYGIQPQLLIRDRPERRLGLQHPQSVRLYRGEL